MRRIVAFSVSAILITASIVVFTLARSSQPLSAQDDPIVTVEPDSAEMRSLMAMSDARQSQSVHEYTIVYYSPVDGVDEATGLSADWMRQYLGAHVVLNWDDVLQQHQQTPISALIIHPTVYNQVDATWTQSAYRHGTAIVVINQYFNELADLTGNGCLDRSATPAFAPNYYVLSYYHLTVEDESARSRLNEVILSHCPEAMPTDQLTGAVNITRNGVQNTLNHESDYTLFADALTTALFSYP
jgi:hypothetical protein